MFDPKMKEEGLDKKSNGMQQAIDKLMQQYDINQIMEALKKKQAEESAMGDEFDLEMGDEGMEDELPPEEDMFAVTPK